MADSSLQEILCCVGQPVAGNPTQYMMEKAFAAAGLDWRYLTCEVSPEKLGDALRGVQALGFHGGSCTIPHKVAVIEYLDGLSEAAALIGAVNCINRVDKAGEPSKYIGENTDGKGFVQSLRTLLDPAGKRVALLGAGGAARAIAVELALAGVVEFWVINRGVERGEELAALLRDKAQVAAHYVAWEGDYYLPETADVVINATSIGLGDAEARVPLDYNTLLPQMAAADVVFNPPQTQFLRLAAERGCPTLDGLGMLVNQAVIAFKIWTGAEPDAAVMREALEEYLEL